MRKQQAIWNTIHQQELRRPSLTFNKPYSGVIYFSEFLDTYTINSHAKILDIGCGKGRNTIYLAKQGYIVFGIDYVEIAVQNTIKLSKQQKVDDRVFVSLAELDKPWPYKDNFFDNAIDCFSSTDIETLKGRSEYKKELFRTLKPGGYAFIAVPSAFDEVEKEIIASNAGKEKNSAILPENNKFQKYYTEEEIKDFYNEFNIVHLETITKKSFKMGKYYSALHIWLIIQKP